MLTITSEYALRALSCLAGRENGTFLGRDLSEQTAVPSMYLSKIMLTLRNEGIVTARRGSRGGYALAKPAKAVTLMRVVEIFDGAYARPKCIVGLASCSDKNPCPFQHRWRPVGLAYIEFLETTTLADVAADGPLTKRVRKS